MDERDFHDTDGTTYEYDSESQLFKPGGSIRRRSRAPRILRVTVARDWITILISLLTLIAVWIYTKYTADTLELSRKALETQTRPWISVDGLPDITLVHPGGVNFNLPIRNYGNYPATILVDKFVFSSLGKPEPRYWPANLGSDLCNDFEPMPGTSRAERKPRFPILVFQNANAKDPHPLPIVAGRHPNLDSKQLYAYLSGCIAYDVGNVVHTTRVIYVLHFAESNLDQKPTDIELKYSDAN